MKGYRLIIELLSDMCVSDGGVYNSSLDIDICQDQYGLPYIPAKRLKGCLRECGMELAEWDSDYGKHIKSIFGLAGAVKNQSSLQLGNAYLIDYADICNEISENQDSVITHPQNVLNYYSYIRTQTSVNYETGTADEASLRTMRVAKKGLIFYADVNWNRELNSEELEFFERCCSIFTHIGVSRTRGLGEIKATLESVTVEPKKEIKSEPVKDSNYLEYEITIQEPVICKSVAGGESNTLDYIEGSKIVGLVVEQLKKKGENLMEFLDQGELFCSNGYIAHKNHRLTEVPASYYAIKNNKDIYVDKIYEIDGSEQNYQQKRWQLNSMKHCYVALNDEGKLIKKDVQIEERYHHRRADDKSIGRAVESAGDNSAFYQMSSIVRGQKFKGYIYGTAEQIKKIYQLLSETQEYAIGYARSAEYGRIYLEVKIGEERTRKVMECQDFCVKLEAPAIIYSDQAMYSTDLKDLIAEVNAELGLGMDCNPINTFVNYTTVGGFQVKWGAKKPVIAAFDKGTLLQYHLETPIALEIPEVMLLGERIIEGYGEASVQIIEKNVSTNVFDYAKEDEQKKEVGIKLENTILLKYICDDMFESFVRNTAVRDADEFNLSENKENKEEWKPVVSNMLRMVQESSDLNQVRASVNARFEEKNIESKKNKNEKANDILKQVVEAGDGTSKINNRLAEEASKQFHIQDDYLMKKYAKDKSTFEMIYLKEFLVELKYRLRDKKER